MHHKTNLKTLNHGIHRTHGNFHDNTRHPRGSYRGSCLDSGDPRLKDCGDDAGV